MTNAFVTAMPLAVSDAINSLEAIETTTGRPATQEDFQRVAEAIRSRYPWFDDLLQSEVSKLEAEQSNDPGVNFLPAVVIGSGFACGAVTRLANTFIKHR